MFSYYVKWIAKSLDKISPLNSISKFPLKIQQVKAFKSWKIELEPANAAIQMADGNIFFTVETDD